MYADTHLLPLYPVLGLHLLVLNGERHLDTPPSPGKQVKVRKELDERA
jgi:hypothetical protein